MFFAINYASILINLCALSDMIVILICATHYLSIFMSETKISLKEYVRMLRQAEHTVLLIFGYCEIFCALIIYLLASLVMYE